MLVVEDSAVVLVVDGATPVAVVGAGAATVSAGAVAASAPTMPTIAVTLTTVDAKRLSSAGWRRLAGLAGRVGGAGSGEGTGAATGAA